MTRKRRFGTVVVVLGSSLLVGTLMWPQHARTPFSAVPAQATSDNAPQSAYAVFLHGSRTAGDRAQGVAELKRAIQLHADKQYREAIAAYDKAAPDLPQIADWIAVFSAASAARLGDTVEVARRLSSVDSVIASGWAWRVRSRAYGEAGAWQRALAVTKPATTGGSAGRRAEAWYRVAELQHDLGNRSAQRAALVAAMKAAPESDVAADAARALLGFDDLAASERLLAGRTLMRAGEITRGMRELERARASGKLSLAQRSQIRYDLGRVLFSLGRYKDAIKQLQAVPHTSEPAADARFLLARSQYRLDRAAAGRRTFKSVISQYPTSRAATRALFFLADLAHDDGDVDDAAEYFERTAAKSSRSSEGVQAVMRLGGIAFVDGKYEKAARIFHDFRTRVPGSAYDDQAAYWEAISKLRAGDRNAGDALLRELHRVSPVSYYGMRAAELLGDSPLPESLRAAPERKQTTTDQIAIGLDRWELLREVGWSDAASFELSRLRQFFSGNTDALYTIAEELQQRGAPHIGIAIGQQLLADGKEWDPRLLRIMYPLPYQPLIEAEARARGLDPYFVAALIRQESRFNTKAVSGAGAVGLMQVMPATGKQVGRGGDHGRITAARLTEPELNIKLGTKFLADLMDMYGRRTDVALVAYNAGPTRADRWRSFPEFKTGDLFIERIPFDETRDYVKVVHLNAAIYRALYGGQEAAD